VIITLVFEKNANFFAENWEKSQKIVIITLVSDWAIFRLLGDGLLWEVFFRKLGPEVAQIFGQIFIVKVLH
jgi:hypothetical protein